jgi:signal peptidase I
VTSGRPNVEPGDHLVVTKLTARDRNPRPGDLITFELPGTTSILFKRVVATEGQTVEIVDNVVHVDGIAYATSLLYADGGLLRLLEQTPEGASYRILVHGRLRSTAPVLVPPGHVFVLGDSRSASHDSRDYGPIRNDAITGRVRAIWWPLDRSRSLEVP